MEPHSRVIASSGVGQSGGLACDATPPAYRLSLQLWEVTARLDGEQRK